MSVATLGAQFPSDAGGLGTGLGSRGNFGQQKPLFNQARAGTSSAGVQRASFVPARASHAQQALTASISHADGRALGPNARGYYRSERPTVFPVPAWVPSSAGSLPDHLYRLLDPSATVELPPSHKISHHTLDNRELDKLVAALGRSKATWRRAIVLHEWLQEIGHRPDDRLCTTLIRLCSAHGAAAQALGLYDWMRSPSGAGGAGLRPTVFTYTAAMRAALNGNLPERAMQVWEDAKAARCTADCRMSTVYIEVCTRAGNATAALNLYKEMAAAPQGSKMAPSVHTYTAAMRAAAADPASWHEALTIWDDMLAAGCTPTGHAYAAAISACATGGEWRRAVALFDGMLENSIQPDVVSCTALISALAADGQWQHAERALEWMLQAGVKPNVRTYTALITAMANAHQWERAVATLRRMKTDVSWRRVEPNAYTYSALLKLLGEQGRCALADKIFSELEAEALQDMGMSASASTSADTDDDTLDDPSLMVLSHNPLSLSTTPGDIWASQEAPRWDSKAQEPPNGIPIARKDSSSSSPGSDAGSDILSSGSFGEMPKLLAEQVLDEHHIPHSTGSSSSSTTAHSHMHDSDSLHTIPSLSLPDSIPGQSNVESPRSHQSMPSSPSPSFRHATSSGRSSDSSASLASHAEAAAVPSPRHQSDWGSLPVQQAARTPFQTHNPGEWAGNDGATADDESGDSKPQAVLNVVVCGALMSAFESCCKFDKAVHVLGRARRLGIKPNTVMFNIALSALGKSGDWQAAEAMFDQVAEPDSITYETIIAAMGMAGQPDRAEAWLEALRDAGHHPRDYTFTALVAAYSLAGNWRAALRVRSRMKRCIPPVQPTVHVYNALIAACDREKLWDQALDLHSNMRREGVQPNQATMSLMAGVGKAGSSLIERQQAMAAALSAAVAAAGSVMMRAGAF